jgi:hypothetical protein
MPIVMDEVEIYCRIVKCLMERFQNIQATAFIQKIKPRLDDEQLGLDDVISTHMHITRTGQLTKPILSMFCTQPRYQPQMTVINSS